MHKRVRQFNRKTRNAFSENLNCLSTPPDLSNCLFPLKQKQETFCVSPPGHLAVSVCLCRLALMYTLMNPQPPQHLVTSCACKDVLETGTLFPFHHKVQISYSSISACLSCQASCCTLRTVLAGSKFPPGSFCKVLDCLRHEHDGRNSHSLNICIPHFSPGGQDLVFPHHENELAQSQAFHGSACCSDPTHMHGSSSSTSAPGSGSSETAAPHDFVRFWMHNGFVNVDSEKMSKSVGNFFTIREVRQEGQTEGKGRAD